MGWSWQLASWLTGYRHTIWMKVAVVGAGPAGLCCARHLTKLKEHFQCQVFEKAKEVGGTWVYTPISSSMDVHSSIYKNLR